MIFFLDFWFWLTQLTSFYNKICQSKILIFFCWFPTCYWNLNLVIFPYLFTFLYLCDQSIDIHGHLLYPQKNIEICSGSCFFFYWINSNIYKLVFNEDLWVLYQIHLFLEIPQYFFWPVLITSQFLFVYTKRKSKK